MSSGGKGGSSASQSKDYYGTLAGAICWGPIDWLTAIIVNGSYLWQGFLTISSDVTDLTGSILDPSYIGTGGYLKLYRGTETQSADSALSGHPPYKGTAFLVGKNLFFGQDNGTAPNIQLICGRLPRVSTSIVASADNIADSDYQINPIAAWAELLMDERGGGVDVSKLDAASWLASAHWCAQDANHIAYTFCSPLIAEQSAMRNIAGMLLDPHNGFCSWTSAGLLACNIYEWGVDPGGLTVLDANAWTKRPVFPFGDWAEVPTELVVNYTDKDYEYQENTKIVPNARAQQIRQVDDQQSIDRKHITRATQAYWQAVEYLRRIGTAPTTTKVNVRNPIVDTLSVGAKVKINTDPEPTGTGFAQLCRVQRIEQNRSDEATLTLMTDNLLAATPYKPAAGSVSPYTPFCNTLAHYLAVPLPPAYFGWPLAVGILATRPDTSVIGMEVFFSDAASGSFDDLGQQLGFAVRCQLAATILSTDTTIQLTELDGVSGPDADLSAHTPGGNAQSAANNTLVMLIATLDGNGRVALDSYGNPIMEFISISNRSLVSGATFSYSVLRGRMDTPALGWTSGAVAWVFPSINLTEWRPDHLESLYGSVAYWRLVAYNSQASDANSTIPECSVNMIPTTSPMYQRGIQGGNSATVYLYQRATSTPSVPGSALTYTFATGVLSGSLGSWSQSIPAGSNPVYVTQAPAFAFGATESIPSAAWTTPVVLAQNGTNGSNGANGANGTNGTNAPNVQFQYSIDGSTSWHSTPTSYDVYFRSSSDGGSTWSSAVLFRGSTGQAPAFTATGSQVSATGTSGSPTISWSLGGITPPSGFKLFFQIGTGAWQQASSFPVSGISLGSGVTGQNINVTWYTTATGMLQSDIYSSNWISGFA